MFRMQEGSNLTSGHHLLVAHLKQGRCDPMGSPLHPKIYP